MKRYPWPVAAVIVLTFATLAVTAGDPPKAKVTPADAPLQLKIIPPKKNWPLDLGGKTPAEYRKSLFVLGNTPLPKQPEIGLKVELKNTGKKEVEVSVGGDPVKFMVSMKGPGVVDVLAQRMFPFDRREPRAVKIPAGGTHTFTLNTLSYGFRDVERRTYWMEPGEFTLSVTLMTAINPGPPTARDARDGFGFVTVTSEPIKLIVEGK